MAKKKGSSFQNHPPTQDKYSLPGGRETSPSTALPLDAPHINTQRGNDRVLDLVSGCGPHGRPEWDDLSTPHITHSRTNGKGV